LEEGIVKIILIGDVPVIKDSSIKYDEEDEDDKALATVALALNTVAYVFAALPFSHFLMTSSCVDQYNFLQAKHVKDCICSREHIIVTKFNFLHFSSSQQNATRLSHI
jgi:hypothetical protein